MSLCMHFNFKTWYLLLDVRCMWSMSGQIMILLLKKEDEQDIDKNFSNLMASAVMLSVDSIL